MRICPQVYFDQRTRADVWVTRAMGVGHASRKKREYWGLGEIFNFLWWASVCEAAGDSRWNTVIGFRMKDPLDIMVVGGIDVLLQSSFNCGMHYMRIIWHLIERMTPSGLKGAHHFVMRITPWSHGRSFIALTAGCTMASKLLLVLWTSCHSLLDIWAKDRKKCGWTHDI